MTQKEENNLGQYVIDGKYLPTIGLEIHAELKTKTKMFCDCLNNPDEVEPNKNICPICMGHPGTLPVLNYQAIKNVLKVGYAVGANIADYTEWDRKNYFYPDIPKGYQISQYKYPLVSGGKIGDVLLTRIHLEEDTASSSHDKGNFSLVNYNRAGVPLMELVTEPVIHSAKQAGDFARELQLLLQYLKVSDANMEKGEMRVEANISVALVGAEKFGTKVEVKNLNSFRSAERAIEYEIKRMIDLLEDGRGEEIIQETRGWDEVKMETFSQRRKETSDDYRYFPEPDLPKLKISEIADFKYENLKQEISELPWERRARLADLGLNEKQVEFFVSDLVFANFLNEGIRLIGDSVEKIKLLANYVSSDLVAWHKDFGNEIFGKVFPAGMVELVDMINLGEISSRGAKDTLAIYVEKGGSPRQIAEQNGLMQKSDIESVLKIIDQVLIENPSQVAEFKAGKEAVMQYLLGQGMKLSKGSINPQVLKDEMLKKLNN